MPKWLSQNSKASFTCMLVALILSQIVACAPPRKVAVEERATIDQRLEVESLGGAHIRIVQPGDTLYGIAFENGLDANRLAAWNGIKQKNRLPVGQRLRLTEPVGFVKPNQGRTQDDKVKPKQKPKTKKPPASQTKGEVSNNAKGSAKSTAKSVSTASSTIKWRWPTEGKVTQAYSRKRGQQGIDIQGRLGQPVLAAAPGEVVYVGNGLKGYGNLVILKHNEEFLSAYAHNQETFVQEGQRIGVAQRIGTLGKNRAGINALHFQIRRHGEPVNPMDFF